MVGVMVLWLLYDYKCISFCLRIIYSAEGRFLFNLQALSNRKQFSLLGGVHLLLYAPVLVYANIVIIVAVQQQRWGAAMAIGAWQLLLLLMGPLMYGRVVNSSWKEQRSFLWHTRTRQRKPKAFFCFPAYYLLHQKWKALLAIKLFSFFLLYVMFLNGRDTGHDYLVLVFLVILLAHVKLPFQLVDFMEGNFRFHRNLPLAQHYIAFSYVFTYVLLLLPDALFLAIKSWDIFPLYAVMCLYCFGVLALFLLTAVLYTDNMNVTEYTKVAFLLFFVSVFGLYSRNYAVLIGAEMVMGVVLFWSGYGRYEQKRLE